MTTTPATTTAALLRSYDVLRDVVAQLSPAHLTLATPCTRWTVAQVLEHAVIDQGIWAHTVADAPAPSGDAFAPTGELPDDLAGSVDADLSAAAAAWASVPATATSVASPLPQGPLEPTTAAEAAALDAAVHAWDIAVAIGARCALDDELAAVLLPTARTLVEPLRQWGAYAAELPAATDDGPVATLLRYLGRDPHWAASA